MKKDERNEHGANVKYKHGAKAKCKHVYFHLIDSWESQVDNIRNLQSSVTVWIPKENDVRSNF